MNPSQRDVLERMGKVIGYTQVYLFTILLMYTGHFTFRTAVCSLPASPFYNVCVGIVVLTLVMLVISFGLTMGILLRQAIYLLPWLFMSPVSVVLIITYLINYGKLSQAIVGSIILFLLIISWYPTHKLYRRYRLESYNRLQNSGHAANNGEENCPLQRISANAIRIMPASTIRETQISTVMNPGTPKVNENPPPTYDEVMACETRHLYLPLRYEDLALNSKIII